VSAVRDGERGPLVEALPALTSSAAPFLTNHDQVRAMRALSGDVDEAKLAAAILLALPGTPFLYYGEEIGLQGGAPSDDENKRTPMRFTDVGPGFGFTRGAPWFRADERAGVDVVHERADAKSLWRTYQALLAVHHQNAALTSPALLRLRTDGGGRGTIALLRGEPSVHQQRVLFVANLAHEGSAPFLLDLKAKALSVLASSPGFAGLVSASDGVHVPALAADGYAFVAVSE
jgi:glycosidase